MKNPNQDPLNSEPTPSIVESIPDNPEKEKRFSRIARAIGSKALEGAIGLAGSVSERVADTAPVVIEGARAATIGVVEGAKAVSEVVVDRAPAVMEGAKGLADSVSGKVAEGYGAVTDGAQEALRRSGELVGPATEVAAQAYEEVVRPIGVDVLTAVGKEYGIESKEGKLDVKTIKFGKAVIRAVRNPAAAGFDALKIARKTALKSSAKMFVT